jgi:two-component system, response regulator PdtaR
MTPSLRIVVADDEPDMREYLRRVLPRLGHEVVGVAANGRELVEICRATSPNLVITDIKMPEMDGIDAAVEIYREHPCAVVLVSAHSGSDLVERAAADHALGYLVKPIKQADLAPAIALAWKRFEEMEKLRHTKNDD